MAKNAMIQIASRKTCAAGTAEKFMLLSNLGGTSA